MQNFEDSQKIFKRKIAIYHTGALGDLLVSTAALFESGNLFPDAEITLIGSRLWKELILPQNWVQVRFILETNKNFNEIKLWQANIIENSWEEKNLNGLNFNKFLKNFDITIDLRSESLRFALKSFFARIPIRVGASKSKIAKFLFTHFSIPINHKIIHERDRYLDILSSVDKKFINEKMNYWNKRGLPSLKVYSLNQNEKLQLKKVILINPTASIREKAWERKKFRELALLLKEKSYEVYIIGSPKETSWLKEIAQDDFSIIQPQKILDIFDIVKKSTLLITSTSSIQFIAASANTPTLTIMGTALPQKWGALGSNSLSLKNTLFKSNYISIFLSKKNRAKLNEIRAYNSISVNVVIENVQKLLLNVKISDKNISNWRIL